MSCSDENEIEPTAEQLETLEHVADQIPLTAWFIVICEFCERFAFIGLSGPFQNHIRFPVPGPNDKQPDTLGLGTTSFQLPRYLTPIFGAIVADQFWGKYKTTAIACSVYVLGLLVLVLTSIPYAIQAAFAFPGLLVAMIILGLATGGLKSNVSPLMAQQYTRTKPCLKEIGGRKKIIDPKITMQSMFTWFYWTVNFGSIASTISTNVENYYSYWLAFLLPVTVCMSSIIVLVVGRRRYIRAPPSGSVILRACRVTITATRMQSRLGRQYEGEHFLDLAKDKLLPINERVFAFFPFFWVCCIPIGSNMISQAAQMNVGPFPNDVLQNIERLFIILLIPVFDKVIYPLLRRANIKVSMISRITYGFLFASLAMGWTAFVQHQIYSTAPNYDYATKPCATCHKFNNINAAWQIPSYILMAISEIFAGATGLEYAFIQAPASMKSIVVSLFLFTTGLGSALNFALLPILVDPKVLWMFVSLSAIAFVVSIVFYLLFRDDEERKG